MGLGSGIRKKPIPDPGLGVKKAPDPGSGSAALDFSQGKKVGAARCEYVYDVHTSKASERL
jgi:hypothetical protein